MDGIDIVAEYETAESRDIESQMSRIGVRATPWERSQINSFVTNETSEFGPRLFANVGLVQGFQMAGAKRIIASLWQVDDEATRLLMQHLYEGMLREKDPLSPAEALREANSIVNSSPAVAVLWRVQPGWPVALVAGHEV